MCEVPVVPPSGYHTGEGESLAPAFHVWPVRPGLVGDAPSEHHRAHGAVSSSGLSQGQLGSGRRGGWQGQPGLEGPPATT